MTKYTTLLKDWIHLTTQWDITSPGVTDIKNEGRSSTVTIYKRKISHTGDKASLD